MWKINNNRHVLENEGRLAQIQRRGPITKPHEQNKTFQQQRSRYVELLSEAEAAPKRRPGAPVTQASTDATGQHQPSAPQDESGASESEVPGVSPAAKTT